jgi:hypothetical protein
MAIEMHEELGGKILIVTLSGKLVKEDYQRFTPVVDRAVKLQGKIRMLVHMQDFHGWTTGALLEDIKFDLRHFADIERLALVGDKKWEAGMAVFCRPFTTAKIRYFDTSKADEASVWIQEGIEQSVASS